ncbi:unnamed protein product, partial [marine sediment metagenome]
NVVLLYRRRHCDLPKQYDNLYVESERNHNTRKTDSQKAGVDLGFTSKFASPDWTMLITSKSLDMSKITPRV